MSPSRRLPLLIGVVLAMITAAAIVVLVLPLATASPPAAGDARITRLFIPAIKTDCRQRSGVPEGTTIGYTFNAEHAVQTLDHDGSLTGVDPDVLREFNACMAQYPVEAVIDPPHDHYSRNLLYDYFVSDLRPCLGDRISDLPELPSRADFVVRLFQWDPYRAIARERTLAQLLEIEGSCPALPDWAIEAA